MIGKPCAPPGDLPDPRIEPTSLALAGGFFGHLMRRADSLKKTLILGKIEGRRRRGQMTEDDMVGWHHQLDGHEFE